MKNSSSPSPRLVRLLGALLIFLGIVLMLIIGYVTHLIEQSIAHHSAAGATRHWLAGPRFTETTFELLHSVFGFGVLSLVGGLWQLATGRRSKVLAALVVLTTLAICYLGYQVLHAPSDL